MKLIARIKSDLNKISEWPWRFDGDDSILTAKGPEVIVSKFVSQNPDMTFIAHSPSRIAALVAYYVAAEAEFQYLGTSGDTSMNRRLKEARARLEKEDG